MTRLRRSARRSGVGLQTLCKWVLQVWVDAQHRRDVTTAEQQRITALEPAVERENRDLKEVEGDRGIEELLKHIACIG